MLDELPGADQYEVEEEVGHGTFSEVHRARDRRSGALVALKHMFLREEGELPRHVLRELAVLLSVRHPAIVSLLDVKQEGFSIALVLEYCLTDLRTLLVALRGGPPLDEAVAKALAQQLLQALARLHSCGWVHRDLAPSNILLAPDGTARLSDFGQARLLPGAPSANGYTAMGGGNDWAASVAEAVAEDTAAPAGSLTPGAALCTRWYKAPELLFNSRTYSAEVDLWGAGCVLAELLTGAPLFPGSSDIAQLALMSDLLGSIHEEEWPGVRELPDWGKLLFKEQAPKDLATALPGAPPQAVQLVAGLLQYNSQRRLSAEQALAAEWFRAEPAPAPPAVVADIVRRALA